MDFSNKTRDTLYHEVCKPGYLLAVPCNFMMPYCPTRFPF